LNERHEPRITFASDDFDLATVRPANLGGTMSSHRVDNLWPHCQFSTHQKPN
jgi:hypothetical protein